MPTLTTDQKSLFDLNLKMVEPSSVSEFIDEVRQRLDKLVWYSEPRQTFYYDDNNRMKLTSLAFNLKGVRRVDKKGKSLFFLQRYWHYSGLEECIEDEIPVGSINDLESCFEDERWESDTCRNLPHDVLFDGHRYCWKFIKRENGTIIFTEKWCPEITESDENAIQP